MTLTRVVVVVVLIDFKKLFFYEIISERRDGSGVSIVASFIRVITIILLNIRGSSILRHKSVGIWRVSLFDIHYYGAKRCVIRK